MRMRGGVGGCGLALAVAGASMVLVAGCAPEPGDREAVAAAIAGEGYPRWLSAWGALERHGERLVPTRRVRVYELATPLYSDHAFKLRTVSVPRDAAVRPPREGQRILEFPVGAVFTKTFYYPLDANGRVRLLPAPHLLDARRALDLSRVRLVETRVLARTRDGWQAAAYLWDDAERSARLARGGALLELTPSEGERFDYLVPDTNQCAGCHAQEGKGGMAPIGPTPGNLEGAAEVVGADSQLDRWHEAGLLTEAVQAQPWPAWDRPGSGSVAARARTYLDVNCAHCHSETGAADTAAVDLRRGAPVRAAGVCKPPVAAGRGSGGLAYDIVPGAPERSILVHRMTSRDPGVMMPELGRALVHGEGVELVAEWIAGMEGSCRDPAVH